MLSNMFNLLAPNPFIYKLAIALVVIGVVVGYIGSWISVTRYLRWKR